MCVLCVRVGVCSDCVWCVCVLLFVCVVVVRHAEKPRVCIHNVPVCTFKTFPCVLATCPHVLYMWACCRYTRERFERTHGDVMNTHTGGRGEEGAGVVIVIFSFPKFAHVGLSRASEVHHKKPLDLTHLRLANRSRTTRSRFLQTFASPL